MLHDSGRAEYVSQDDAATLTPCQAGAHRRNPPRDRERTRRRRGMRVAPVCPHDILVVNLSGRGDKDMGILAQQLNIQGA